MKILNSISLKFLIRIVISATTEWPIKLEDTMFYVGTYLLVRGKETCNVYYLKQKLKSTIINTCLQYDM